MLVEIRAHRLIALIALTAACGPAPPGEAPVAVVPSSPPVVEVPPAKDSAPDAKVAASDDDRAAPDPQAPTATVAASTPALRGPRADTLEALRFPPARKPPRALALVATELRQLLALFTAAPPGAPDRPKLMRRIADDYVELEATGAQQGNDKAVADAQREAIKYYAALDREAPNFCSTLGAQSSGCGDEVLYFLGHEYERGNLPTDARKTYLTLIERFPASPYVPGAYLAFGEIFFQEAAADPSKWPLAEKCYDEVLKYPPPNDDVYGYALLRLGAVYQGENEPRKAHIAHEKLRKGAAAHPDWDVFTVPASLIPAGAP